LTDHLGRWLWRPATRADSAAGALIYGVVIIVVFRFAFGDSWAFAVGAGVLLAVASFFFTEWSRKRRPRAG
jgi:hypothetical protein